MSSQANVGGAFTLPGTSLTINRMGYGAMQLPGPHVWGPPRDKQAALAVLREAAALGINHIDTADFYGPRVSNQLIREALQPYPNNLVIVTKIGYARGADGSWIPAVSRAELEAAVKDNLRNLALESLDVVNLRFGGPRGRIEASVEEPLSHLLKLQSQGLVKHIGLSNVTHAQVTEGSKVASIVCVQNKYNLAHREDDALLDNSPAKASPTPLQAALGETVPTSVVRYAAQIKFDEYVEAAASAMPMQNAILIAESFSGPVALTLAARYPTRVRALVLCATFAQSPFRSLLRAARYVPASLFGPTPLQQALLRHFCFNGEAGTDARLIERAASIVRAVSASTMRARLVILAGVDMRPLLPRIVAPVLCLQASRDRIVGAHLSRELASRLPKAVVNEIDGPHLLLQCRPRECAAAILSFARQCGAVVAPDAAEGMSG